SGSCERIIFLNTRIGVSRVADIGRRHFGRTKYPQKIALNQWIARTQKFPSTFLWESENKIPAQHRTGRANFHPQWPAPPVGNSGRGPCLRWWAWRENAPLPTLQCAQCDSSFEIALLRCERMLDLVAFRHHFG